MVSFRLLSVWKGLRACHILCWMPSFQCPQVSFWFNDTHFWNDFQKKLLRSIRDQATHPLEKLSHCFFSDFVECTIIDHTFQLISFFNEKQRYITRLITSPHLLFFHEFVNVLFGSVLFCGWKPVQSAMRQLRFIFKPNRMVHGSFSLESVHAD